MIKLHPGFVLIEASGTYGKGSADYVGRDQLGIATLQQFATNSHRETTMKPKSTIPAIALPEGITEADLTYREPPTKFSKNCPACKLGGAQDTRRAPPSWIQRKEVLQMPSFDMMLRKLICWWRGQHEPVWNSFGTYLRAGRPRCYVCGKLL